MIQRKLRPRRSFYFEASKWCVMARLLSIGPNSDFRRSVDFLLGIDGHIVSWRPRLDGGPIPMEFDCTLLDDESIGANMGQAERFCRAFRPVILLSSRSDHPLSAVAFRTVLKPLAGSALSDAVALALKESALAKSPARAPMETAAVRH